MSKDCGNHAGDDLRQACRRILAALLVLALLVGLIALIVYLVLRPTHPRFYLKDAALRQLDLSTTNASSAVPLLSTTLQATVASYNPNARVGVYYDRLDVYASYRSQQVTLASGLPPVYQGHGDVDVWSPVLSGPAVPFAPFLADALAKDVAAGFVVMQVRIDGRVRWKVGTWISGHYHIFVTCPAYFVAPGGGGGGGGSNGATGTKGLVFQAATYCGVEV